MGFFMRRYWWRALLGCGVILLAGCVGFKEGMRGLLGTSTKAVEDARPKAIKKEFGFDYAVCYNKVKEILIKEKVPVYREDVEKKMLAVYVSEEDTTPVGIFFEEKSSATTGVEVSSASTYAKELISEKVFSGLNKALNPQEEKGPSDESK